MLNQPPQYVLNLKDDYTRTLKKQYEKRDVPQLGMQEKQSIPPPLQVYPEVPLARQYVYGQPLVDAEKLREMPTIMRKFHDWYMKTSERGEQQCSWQKLHQTITSVKTRSI
jgi:hypothetical protein